MSKGWPARAGSNGNPLLMAHPRRREHGCDRKAVRGASADDAGRATVKVTCVHNMVHAPFHSERPVIPLPCRRASTKLQAMRAFHATCVEITHHRGHFALFPQTFSSLYFG